MPILIVVSLLKFLLPLLIFKYAFWASFSNFILDSIDGDILMHFGMSYPTYTMIDKSADFVTYIILFLVGRKWKIGKTITVLFLFRAVGQFLFFTTHVDKILFFFPNFLEPLFIIYSYLVYRYGKNAHTKYKKYFWYIWIFILIFKMWNEYNVHIGHIDLSEKYLGINN